MPEKQTIFISCGQVTPEEKELGAAICRLVEELTPFAAYFAEYQSSLEGLSNNILGALQKSVGLIAVLHPRGTVRFPDGSERVRASVWVEQEIAIASYLTQMEGRNLNLAAYAHVSVSREGMRDQLLINPQRFTSNQEVLTHLVNLLPTWTASKIVTKENVEIRLEHRKLRSTQERHEYQLQVAVINRGNETIDKYYLEVLFPNDYLEQSTIYSCEVRERRTNTHRLMRITQDAHKRSLFPGDPVVLFKIEYYVDQELFVQKNGEFNETVSVTLFVPGRAPEKREIRMQNLQIF